MIDGTIGARRRLRVICLAASVLLSATGVLGWLGISTAVAALSCLWPAIVASRRSVREAISYE